MSKTSPRERGRGQNMLDGSLIVLGKDLYVTLQEESICSFHNKSRLTRLLSRSPDSNKNRHTRGQDIIYLSRSRYDTSSRNGFYIKTGSF